MSTIKCFYAEFLVLWRLIVAHHAAIVIVTSATIIMVLLQNNRLPFSFGDWAVNGFVYYGLIMLFISMAITRKSPVALGLGVGDYKFWIPASILYLVLSTPVTYVALTFENSLSEYYSRDFSFWDYLGSVTLFLLGWEYLFRGSLIFGLKDSLKEGAIFVQMVPFVLLHYGKPEAEIISCIFPGFVWGYICYRGNSFWPAFFMHLYVNLFVTFSWKY